MEEIKNILGDSFDEFMEVFESIIHSARHPFDKYSELENLLFDYGLELDYLETLLSNTI